MTFRLIVGIGRGGELVFFFFSRINVIIIRFPLINNSTGNRISRTNKLRREKLLVDRLLLARVFPCNSNGTMNRRTRHARIGDNTVGGNSRHCCYAYVFGHETRHGYRLDLISTSIERGGERIPRVVFRRNETASVEDGH